MNTKTILTQVLLNKNRFWFKYSFGSGSYTNVRKVGLINYFVYLCKMNGRYEYRELSKNK